MASVLCHLVLTQLSALIKPSAGTHLGLSDLSWGITWSAPVLWEIRWVFFTPERLSPVQGSVLGGRLLVAPEGHSGFWNAQTTLDPSEVESTG